MKKTLFEEAQGVALGAILLSIILLMSGMTPTAINKKWEKEAVEKGHAEWMISPDGSTVFRWKSPVSKRIDDSSINPILDSLSEGPPELPVP
jgi:hypothetical protein